MGATDLTSTFVPSTWVQSQSSTDPQHDTRLTFVDNVVRRSEGSGLYCAHCTNDVFSNNELTEIGYPFARALEMFGFKGGQLFERNTIRTDGAGGIGQVWGSGTLAQLNHISDSGLLITDNQGIGGGKPTTYATFQLNWVVDSRGLGLRFDAGEDGLFGHHNNMMMNVVTRNRQGGLSGKANEALHFRNTAIDNQGGSDPENPDGFAQVADLKIAACYPHDCVASSGSREGQQVAFTNIGSVTLANVGRFDSSTAGRDASDVPGTYQQNVDLAVETTLTINELMRDVANYDFRPLPGGPLVGSGLLLTDVSDNITESGGLAGANVGLTADVGAYDVAPSIYWIPGRQSSTTASRPVPPNNATGVRPDADLMFLPAAAAVTHYVYLGAAGASLVRVRELVASDTNIATPLSKLVPGVTYEWRVDEVLPGGSIVTGETWSFTAGCADSDCLDCGASTEVASCVVCGSGLVAQGGRCAPVGGCLGGTWEINATALVYGSDVRVGVAGAFNDSFSVQQVPSSGCAVYGHDQWRLVDQDGTDLQGLSCSNNRYSLSTRFRCNRCANGFNADAGVPSGCTVLGVPSRPPTPPPPEIAAPPSSPPPTYSLPACLTKITRKLLETPSISSSCSGSNVQVGVGGSAGSCSRQFSVSVVFFELPSVAGGWAIGWEVASAQLLASIAGVSGSAFEVVVHGLGLRASSGASLSADDYYVGLTDPNPNVTLLSSAFAAAGLSTDTVLTPLDVSAYVRSLVAAATA